MPARQQGQADVSDAGRPETCRNVLRQRQDEEEQPRCHLVCNTCLLYTSFICIIGDEDAFRIPALHSFGNLLDTHYPTGAFQCIQCHCFHSPVSLNRALESGTPII